MNPSRGEMWLVNLDPTIGDEIRKMRPAVVVSRDTLGILALRVVVPVTGWQDRFAGSDWLVRLNPTVANGLDKTSAADAFQVRSISARRFVRLLGRLNDEEMRRLSAGLKAVLPM